MDRRGSGIKPLMQVSRVEGGIDHGATCDTSNETRTDSETATGIQSVHGVAHPFACTPTPRTADLEIRLIKAAKLGDRRAFSELTSRYTGAIYQRMLRLVQNREDAEDLVQETLLKAFNHLDQFRGAAKFSTWLFKIGTNSALALLRSRRRCQERSYEQRNENDESWGVLDFPDPAPNAEQVYAKYQANCLISLAIQQLPRTYRTLLRGYHEEERPLADVARVLGISIGAAKSRLFRARVTLRSLLSDVRHRTALVAGLVEDAETKVEP